MKRSFITITVCLLFTSMSFACKCAAPPPDLKTRLAWAEWRLQGVETVFEGKVESIEVQGWPIKPEPGATITVHPLLLVTFTNVHQYRGALRPKFIVQTGLGGGDCGYPFMRGESYLVDARSGDSGTLHTGICSGTEKLEDAGTALRLLRGKVPSPDDVSDLASDKAHWKAAIPDHARVCGKISFPSGTKPASATVRIWPAGNDRPPLADEDETEADGSFCFQGIEAGKYFIGASETEPGKISSRFIGYYPSVPHLSQAKPIDFRNKEDVKAELTLTRQPLYNVSGYLRGVPESLAGSIQVMLMTNQDDPFQVLDPLPLGPHGVFEFRGVPPGRYTAFAFHQNEDDSMTFLSSVEKLEIQGNVDDLKLEYFSRK
jgi:hypothetical protein